MASPSATADEHYRSGTALEAAGEHQAARAEFERAYAADPRMLVARFAIGAQDEALGRGDETLKAYVAALGAAQRDGLLEKVDEQPPELARRIHRAFALVRMAREAVLRAALDPLRQRHGGEALQRIDLALAGYVGATTLVPPHPLQRPAFLFVPGLPAQPWFERADFPFLAGIEGLAGAIRMELLEVLGDRGQLAPYIDMPEDAPAAPIWRKLNRSASWSSYHFHRDGERVGEHCRRCPATAAALDALPLMRIPQHSPEALFSVLEPHTRIPPHTGVINGRLTVHLPLLVPPMCGGLRVGEETRFWEEGKCLVFDDSMVHEAWNDSDHTRAVLIFDIWNPYLTLPEREALSAAIETLGHFNRYYGGESAQAGHGV